LSRGQDDATTKKSQCSYKVEYFRLNEDELLESVSVYADGLAYRSRPAPFPVPVGVGPSTASAYDQAQAKAQACEKKRKEEAKAEKELRKKVEAMRQLLGSPLAVAQAEPAALTGLPVGVAEPAPECSEATPTLLMPAQPTTPPPHLLDDFTVLDLEFQGTDLLEVAAIRYRNWEPVGELVSFVQFRSPVWRPITELTGITALHVYDAPAEKWVLQQFKKLAGDSLLVCHNLSADRRILEAARTRQGAQQALANQWLCTLALARKRRPKGAKCGLSELCHDFKIKTRGAHRAKRDVEMCFQLLRRFHEQQPITKGDLHGPPQSGKSRKHPPAVPGLFASAA
jgi:DNA polymerase-3 subunit epsilon